MEPAIGVEIGRQSHAVYPWTVAVVHGPDAKTGRRVFWTECASKEEAEDCQVTLMEQFGVPGWSTHEAASAGRSADLVAETTYPRPLAEHEAEFDAAHAG